MSPLTIGAIYFVVWWIMLFAVLPFGIRTQEEAGEVTLGTTPSAPTRPRLVRVAIINTIVSAILVLLFWAVVQHFGLSLEDFAHLLDAK
jgi:predicted secreted protein